MPSTNAKRVFVTVEVTVTLRVGYIAAALVLLLLRGIDVFKIPVNVVACNRPMTETASGTLAARWVGYSPASVLSWDFTVSAHRRRWVRTRPAPSTRHALCPQVWASARISRGMACPIRQPPCGWTQRPELPAANQALMTCRVLFLAPASTTLA